MPFTNFPYGVTSFGAPMMPGLAPVPTGSFPSNSKQVPNYNGVQFINADHGNDGYDGLSPQYPLKNLDTAYNRCNGGQNELIYILGGSAAVTFTTAVTTAGFTMSKSEVHIIGLASGVPIGSRARVTSGASTVLMTPMITLSGSGCTFYNLEIANVGNDATGAAVPLKITGSRNGFYNCQISGGFTATTAGNAAMRSLVITGPGGENYFKNCYIGLDTIDRSSTQTEIEFTAGTPRNVFEDCIISTYTSAGNNFFVKIGADGIDRFLGFRRCSFLNASTLSGGTVMANAFSLDAACGGQIHLYQPAFSLPPTATAATKTDLFFDNVNGSTTTGKDLVAGW